MRVLIVVHGYPPLAQGGSEVYAEAHARTLRDVCGDEVLVLTRDNDPRRPEFDLREGRHRGVPVVRVNNTFRSVRSFAESYTQPRLAEVAATVIDDFAPEAAHIHHLTCLSTFIPMHLASRGVPCFMTLHDYWLLCHRGQLLDRDLRVCASPGKCGRCLDDSAASLLESSPGTLARRLGAVLPPAGRNALRATGTAVVRGLGEAVGRAPAAAARLTHMREVAASISRFYAPSKAMRDTFVAAGFATDRIALWPYGFERERLAGPRTERTRGPLRIGFVGSLMVSKAPYILLEAFRQLPVNSATLDLFGAPVPYHGDNSYHAQLAPLLTLPGVTTHGGQPAELMRQAYDAIDVLVVPSIWPENSPLVIHEAFLAGVPVVASDIGGIAELVRHGENGLLVPPGDASALRDALSRLLREPELLASLAARPPVARTIEDDVRGLRAGYAGEREHRAGHPGGGARVHAVVLNYQTPEQTLLAVRSLLAVTPALASITVVDNSGTIHCRRMIADVAFRVDYCATADNLGYAGGMNLGIRRALAAGATHVLLVNSDVTVPPDCVSHLLDALSSTRAGIAGPTALVRATPDLVDSAGLSFDAGSGRMRMRRANEPARARRGAADVVEAVDAVSGCVMLIDCRVFERIGLLDDDYFFGFEDIDFCLRARAEGYLSVISDAPAYHERAQSMPATSSERLYYAARNHLRLVSRVARGAGYARRLLTVTMLNLAYALKAPPSRIPARLHAVVAGVHDYRRGHFGRRR